MFPISPKVIGTIAVAAASSIGIGLIAVGELRQTDADTTMFAEPTTAANPVSWSGVDAGSNRSPMVAIDESLQPNANGVRFFIGSRPAEPDVAILADGTMSFQADDVDLQLGLQLEATWTDRHGIVYTSRHMVGGVTTIEGIEGPATIEPTQPAKRVNPPEPSDWLDVAAGSGRQPTIVIDGSVYPNTAGVQFLINGQADDRNKQARPNGYDATGPQENSTYHVYPDITLQAGDTVSARWIDRNGSPRSSDVIVSGDPATPAPAPTPSPAPSPGSAPPSTAGMPTMQSIIDNAGLSNPSILQKSGTVTVTTPGTVIENLDITGNIIIKANNVTIRNVRVTGSSSTAVIKPNRDVRGTTVEHCRVHVTDGGANGGIGYLGYDTTVRNCHITGLADGIKVESGGLYEGNYIAMTKPAGSAKHLDGMQASSDRQFTIRHNVIDADIARGGNAAVLVQAWNGAKNANIYDIHVTENYVSGGNFTIYMTGGKDLDGSDPEQWISDAWMTNNVFITGTERYGLTRVSNCNTTVTTGNITSTGATINPCN